MSQPLISVIMSAYNSEQFIVRSLISLLIQTISNFEILIIDDGSNDKTADLIKSIKDDRIILIERENAGLTKSLNFALSKARGIWIARQDADDISMYNRFECQLDFLKRNPEIGLLGSACFLLHDKYDLVNEAYLFPVTHDEIQKALYFVTPFVHGSMMINRRLLEENGGYNEDYRYVQDYELWNRLVSKTKAHNLRDPLYIRSVHHKSSEIQVDKEPIFQQIRCSFFHDVQAERTILPNESPITSVSVWPAAVTRHQKMYNKILSQQFLEMSKECRKRGLSWRRLMLNGFLHYPWSYL
ncbi:glycosyltransferase [Candidatus Roizmanbacteria bacterium]|nr:glycosyltransferase [Candidatus Roizmanbacteria bacterium]